MIRGLCKAGRWGRDGKRSISKDFWTFATYLNFLSLILLLYRLNFGKEEATPITFSLLSSSTMLLLTRGNWLQEIKTGIWSPKDKKVQVLLKWDRPTLPYFSCLKIRWLTRRTMCSSERSRDRFWSSKNEKRVGREWHSFHSLSSQ